MSHSKSEFFCEKSIGRDGKAVIYHPKEVNPALMFHPFFRNADLRRNNNLYVTLTKLAEMADLIIDSEPDYCYVPLEGSKNLFVCSNIIKLKLRGNLKIEGVYVYSSDNRLTINGVNVDSEILVQHYSYKGFAYTPSYTDLTRFFVRAKTQEFLVTGGYCNLLIFCSE